MKKDSMNKLKRGCYKSNKNIIETWKYKIRWYLVIFKKNEDTWQFEWIQIWKNKKKQFDLWFNWCENE